MITNNTSQRESCESVMSPDNINGDIINSVADVGYRVWMRRQAMKMTQAQTAAYCGVGIRFISDLENGKATMEFGRVMRVLSRLGLMIKIENISRDTVG